MKKIALLISVTAILAGCAELPSASKQSLVNGDTTARPAAQEVIATSKGSLVPTSRPAAATHKGLCVATHIEICATSHTTIQVKRKYDHTLVQHQC